MPRPLIGGGLTARTDASGNGLGQFHVQSADDDARALSGGLSIVPRLEGNEEGSDIRGVCARQDAEARDTDHVLDTRDGVHDLLRLLYRGLCPLQRGGVRQLQIYKRISNVFLRQESGWKARHETRCTGVNRNENDHCHGRQPDIHRLA